MNDKTRKLLEYLQQHPNWHYGLDLVKAGVGNRGSIYIRLGGLIEGGYVETKDVPMWCGTRPMYRATGKRVEDRIDDSSLVLGH